MAAMKPSLSLKNSLSTLTEGIWTTSLELIETKTGILPGRFSEGDVSKEMIPITPVESFISRSIKPTSVSTS